MAMLLLGREHVEGCAVLVVSDSAMGLIMMYSFRVLNPIVQGFKLGLVFGPSLASPKNKEIEGIKKKGFFYLNQGLKHLSQNNFNRLSSKMI